MLGMVVTYVAMLLLFWAGDRMASHNQLRQFLLQYHVPRPDGRVLRENPVRSRYPCGRPSAAR